MNALFRVSRTAIDMPPHCPDGSTAGAYRGIPEMEFACQCLPAAGGCLRQLLFPALLSELGHAGRLSSGKARGVRSFDFPPHTLTSDMMGALSHAAALCGCGGPGEDAAALLNFARLLCGRRGGLQVY